ncbi:MAG: hypothetical protein FK731_14395 [Asgard group archaeon]|nr:hypothetical protein [Asgard group archaeon]
MRVEKIGSFNLKRTLTRDIQSLCRSSLLFLDRLLEYTEKQNSKIYKKVIQELIMRFKSEIKKSSKLKESLDLEPIKSKVKMILNYQDLVDVSLDLILSLLQLPEEYNWESNELTILHITLDQAVYIPRYFAYQVFIDLLGRKEAIQYLKEFTDYYVLNFRDVTKYDNLTKIFEDDIERGNKSDSSIFIAALVNEGKYVGKCLKCMGHEAMKMLPDKEISELVLCYGDYTLIRKMNENFAVTRNYTLNTGPYCDLCVHDTRKVKEVIHPNKEFFDKL